MISSTLNPSFLVLALSAFISTADAQIPTCTTTSPQCCWVVRIWKQMGQSTSVDPNNPTACCTGIIGVTCSGSTVTRISWMSKGLTGSLTSDIGKLINLESLALVDNQLTGAIPSTIGNLVKMKMLQIGMNKFTGSIPSTIGNLKELTILDLANCQLTGSIPTSIGNLAKLYGLYLDHNLLTGSIPSNIGNLIGLRTLFLDYNQLTGSIPSAIGNIPNLAYIILSYNKLTGSIPSSIGNLKSLQWLRLSNNQFTGTVPSAIGSLTGLTWLSLSSNTGLTGPFTSLCSTKVYSSNTGITLCGCSSSRSPAFIFPPSSTPAICLSTGPASPLSKRILAFSQNVGSLKFTCFTDFNKNPYQDCLNSMAYLCNPGYVGSDPNRITACKSAVDQMTNGMNSHWQNVRKECGQWSFGGTKGDFTSSRCSSANAALRDNAYYLLPDGSLSYVATQLTESVRLGLWNNVALRG